MARNEVAKTKTDVENQTLTFTFADTPATVLTLDLNQLSEGLIKRLALHGAKQKIGDSYAGVKGDVKAAIENASRVLEAFLAGEFGVERGEGESASLLEQAYFEVIRDGIPGQREPKPEVTQAETTALLKTKSDDAKKAIRALPAVVEAIGRIQLARANEKAKAATAGTEDLF
jgi:hypothetical protein